MVLGRGGATAFVLLLALADAALADLATGFVAQPATELAAPAAGSPAASKRSGLTPRMVAGGDYLSQLTGSETGASWASGPHDNQYKSFNLITNAKVFLELFSRGERDPAKLELAGDFEFRGSLRDESLDTGDFFSGRAPVGVELEEKVLGSTTLARVVGAIGMPASSTVKKIEYYDFSVDPTDSSRIFFRGRLPNAQQPSQRCSMTFDAQGLVRTLTLEVLGEQPKGKEKNLINRVLQIMDENAPADGASSAPSAPAGRRIDYGAGYDPRNRPPAASSSSTAASSPAWSSAPAAAAPAPVRRKIDYGAGYDPRNRPSGAQAAPVAAAPPTHEAPAAVPAHYSAVAAPVQRKIDYGAGGYDPKNRGPPSRTVGRIETDSLSSAPAKQWRPYGGYDPKTRRSQGAAAADSGMPYSPPASVPATSAKKSEPAPSVSVPAQSSQGEARLLGSRTLARAVTNYVDVHKTYVDQAGNDGASEARMTSAPAPVRRKIDYGATGYVPDRFKPRVLGSRTLARAVGASQTGNTRSAAYSPPAAVTKPAPAPTKPAAQVLRESVVVAASVAAQSSQEEVRLLGSRTLARWAKVEPELTEQYVKMAQTPTQMSEASMTSAPAKKWEPYTGYVPDRLKPRVLGSRTLARAVGASQTGNTKSVTKSAAYSPPAAMTKPAPAPTKPVVQVLQESVAVAAASLAAATGPIQAVAEKYGQRAAEAATTEVPADAAAVPVRRKIDYGAGYDPKNRPTSTASVAPAAAGAYPPPAPPAAASVVSAAAAPAVGEDEGRLMGSRTLARAVTNYVDVHKTYVNEAGNDGASEARMTSAPAPVRRKIDYGATGYVPDRFKPRVLGSRTLARAIGASQTGNTRSAAYSPPAAMTKPAPAPTKPAAQVLRESVVVAASVAAQSSQEEVRLLGSRTLARWAKVDPELTVQYVKMAQTPTQMTEASMTSAPAKKWEPYAGYDPKNRRGPAGTTWYVPSLLGKGTETLSKAVHDVGGGIKNVGGEIKRVFLGTGPTGALATTPAGLPDPAAAVSPAVTASMSVPAPVRRKIDYGAGYDPRNRPSASVSSAPAAAAAPAWSAAAPAPAPTPAAVAPPPAGRKIDYGAPYDPRNRASAAVSAAPAAAAPAWSAAPAAVAPAATGRKIDYGAGYDPRNRPSASVSSAPAAAAAPAWSAAAPAPAPTPAAVAPPPAGRKIDYGAPYDPRNRASAAVSAAPAAAAPAWSAAPAAAAPAATGRKIDYGAGYDPRNRPSASVSSAPAAAAAPAWSAAAPAPAPTPAAVAPPPAGRKIDYGAPYDPRNRASAAVSAAPAAAAPAWSAAPAAAAPAATGRKIDYGAGYDPRNRPASTAAPAAAAISTDSWTVAAAAPEAVSAAPAAAAPVRPKIDYGATGYDPKRRGPPIRGEIDVLSTAPAKRWSPPVGYVPRGDRPNLVTEVAPVDFEESRVGTVRLPLQSLKQRIWDPMKDWVKRPRNVAPGFRRSAAISYPPGPTAGEGKLAKVLAKSVILAKVMVDLGAGATGRKEAAGEPTVLGSRTLARLAEVDPQRTEQYVKMAAEGRATSAAAPSQDDILKTLVNAVKLSQVAVLHHRAKKEAAEEPTLLGSRTLARWAEVDPAMTEQYVVMAKEGRPAAESARQRWEPYGYASATLKR